MSERTTSDERLAYRDEFRIELDRHGTAYRTEFEERSDDLHARCPIAWNDTHGGYWFVNGNAEVFDIARQADLVSNDGDPFFERRGYDGIQIPAPPREFRRATGGNFLELDPPAQRHYRQALNPYLSPAAVARWQPIMDELTRASIDEVIESGQIDFVDDLANIVPAVLTMAMLGLPMKDWDIYCEPIHAQVYTKPDTPEFLEILELLRRMGEQTMARIAEIRANPRPGLIDALLTAEIDGHRPTDEDVLSASGLLMGGGFDTTTALTAHSLEWLSQNPAERTRLINEWDTLRDSATEEFLRYYTPAPGDGRTITEDRVIDGVQLVEGERLWLSWAMANRDEKVFDDPHHIHMDRTGNRHSSFGLGIHRCIGSNVARATYKTMLKAVLDRMPDFVCDESRAVHYDTTGVINGMKSLPATFTPGPRLGAGLVDTIAYLQGVVDEQRLADPVTTRRQRDA